jgi:hypothetical protein
MYVTSWYNAMVSGNMKGTVSLHQSYRQFALQMSHADHLWLATRPYFLELHEYNAVVVHAGVVLVA